LTKGIVYLHEAIVLSNERETERPFFEHSAETLFAFLNYSFRFDQSGGSPLRPPAQKQQGANQNRLQQDNGDNSGYAPLVLLPQRELAEPHDAARRQAVLDYAPTLKLAPVEHRTLGASLNRYVIRRCAAHDPHRNVREFGCIAFQGPDIAPDDS